MQIFSVDRIGNHMMLDLETCGSKPNSVILTVAAVRFNPWADNSDINSLLDMDTFYRRVDTASYDGMDHSLDDSTMSWWSRQSEEAKAEAFAEHDRHKIDTVLTELRQWARDPDSTWANGLAFDVPMIEHGCRQTQQAEPWRWWTVRDARTVYALCPEIQRPTGSAHHALFDCWAQIVQLQQCLKTLNITRLRC